MGIKTRFCPMGTSGEGGVYPEIPNAWSYNNRINEAGKNVRTLYFYNNTIGGNYVKVPRGYTELQDYQEVTSPYNNTYETLPFYSKRSLVSVELNQVPFINNSMYNAFFDCSNLTSVNAINRRVTNMCDTFKECSRLNQNIRIPNSVTSMSGTFDGCSNLNQNIRIPNSVTSMVNAFQNCTNLNQNIKIPNSVTSMSGTFRNCNNLNQNIQIPNSVTSMSGTFHGCSNLNQNIRIPNSVTIMFHTFRNCNNLNQNIRIPNSVTDMLATFRDCNNLNQNIQIPNSVISVSDTFRYCNSLNQNIQIPNSVISVFNTFYGCTNLSQAFIKSANISSATNCFNNTSLPKNIFLPYRFINNALTTTATSFNSAGYIVGSGVGNSTINGCVMYDFIAGDYNTYVGNGTHWLLRKWNGKISGYPTDVVVPSTITTYDTFPTAVNTTTFNTNSLITSISISSDIQWEGNKTGHYTNKNSWSGAFVSCANLQRADIDVANGVTLMAKTFYLCSNLQRANITVPETATNLMDIFLNNFNLVNTRTPSIPSTLVTDGMVKSSDIAEGLNVASMHIPDSVTNVQGIYYGCKLLDTILVDGMGVTQASYVASYTNTRNVNLYIKSPLVSNIVNYRIGAVNTYSLNVHIPYLHANGVYTATYNTFNADAATRNNATSNVWMYDISPYNSIADYAITTATPNVYLNYYRGLNNSVNVITTLPFDPSVATDIYLTTTTFKGKTDLTSIELNNLPIAGTSTYLMFQGCSNVETINGLNIADKLNCQQLFDGCSKLYLSSFEFPNTVSQAQYAFRACSNIKQVNISFGQDCVNYRETFNGCSNLSGDIYFHNWTTSSASNQWNGTFTGYNTSLRRNLHCYFTYQNGVETPIYTYLKGQALYNNNATSNFYLVNIGNAPV